MLWVRVPRSSSLPPNTRSGKSRSTVALLPLTNPTQCQIGRLTIVTATLRTNRSGFKQLGAPAGPTDVVDMVDVAVDVVDVHRLARQSGEDSRATHGPWVMGHGHGPWLAAVAPMVAATHLSAQCGGHVSANTKEKRTLELEKGKRERERERERETPASAGEELGGGAALGVGEFYG